MMFIEYKVLSSRGLISQAQCNELGKEGWVLSTIFRDQSVLFYYFFRVEEIEDPPKQSTVTPMDSDPTIIVH